MKKSKDEILSIIRQVPSARACPEKRRQSGTGPVSRVLAALLMAAGAACVLLTEQVYRALPWILGGLMVVIGLNHILCGVWTREYQSRETKFTANGIVYFALGLVILTHRADADSVIGSVWGMLGLMKGSEALNESLYRLSRKESFLPVVIQAAVELILGFLLLTDPSSAVAHHVFLLGLELILVGWQALWESRPA